MPAPDWYTALLGGKNPYGTVGGDASANPALMGWDYVDNPGGEGPGSWTYGPNSDFSLGSNIQVGPGATYGVIDPSQVKYDPKWGAITPQSNFHIRNDAMDRFVSAMPYLLAAGGGAAIAGAGEAGAGASSGKGGTGGYVDAIGNAAEGANAGASLTGAVTPGAGVAAGNTLPDSYWGMQANAGNVASDAALQPGSSMFGPGGGLDPETLGGLGGGASAPSGNALLWQNFLNDPAGMLGRQIGGSSLVSDPAGALSGLVSSALQNPLQAYGLIQTGMGLLARHGGSQGASGGAGGANKGGGSPMGLNVQRPAYVPNAYTQAQLRQLYGS